MTMKNIFRSLFLISLSVFIFYSCSKDSNPVTPVTPPSNDTTYANIQWTPGTVPFEASDLSAVLTNNEDYTNITFSKSNSKAAKW